MAFAAATQNILGYQGINLSPMPLTPGFKDITWNLKDTTTPNVSPYTGTQQNLLWPGADKWACTVTMPTLNRAQAAQWEGWLLGLCGRTHAFQLGDQLYSMGYTVSTTNAPAFNSMIPQLSPFEDGLTPGINTGLVVVGSYTLPMTGFPTNTPVFLTGDIIQVNYRMYKVTQNVTSLSDGSAVVPVWPSIREVPSVPVTVDLVNPVGLFRRADDEQAFHHNMDGTVSFSIRCEEVK